MILRDTGLAKVLQLLFARRFPHWFRYGSSLGLAVIFVALGISVSPHELHLVLFMPAVLFAALVFGAKPGVLAAALTTLAGAVFMTRTETVGLNLAGAFLSLVAYGAMGVAIASLCHLLRGTLRRAVVAERAKTLLLEDMAHRTKNDLQMVASLLTLQARGLADSTGRSALEGAAARIQAIAKLHNRLRSDGEGGVVDMHDYLDDLCRDLSATHGELRPVAMKVESDHVVLGTGIAASVGLIVNELVTNAFKYAFPADASGTIEVAFHRADNSGLVLRVADDGIGLTNAREGLGSRLIRLLIQQIDGTLQKSDHGPGTTATVTFPTP